LKVSGDFGPQEKFEFHLGCGSLYRLCSKRSQTIEAGSSLRHHDPKVGLCGVSTTIEVLEREELTRIT
jgi:hypothetical protein